MKHFQSRVQEQIDKVEKIIIAGVSDYQNIVDEELISYFDEQLSLEIPPHFLAYSIINGD